jgi:hypothetical protein
VQVLGMERHLPGDDRNHADEHYDQFPHLRRPFRAREPSYTSRAR